MRDVAELLERKKTLLDRRREGKAGKVAEVEQELREIDEVLSRLEGKEAAIPRHTLGHAPVAGIQGVLPLRQGLRAAWSRRYVVDARR